MNYIKEIENLIKIIGRENITDVDNIIISVRLSNIEIYGTIC